MNNARDEFLKIKVNENDYVLLRMESIYKVNVKATMIEIFYCIGNVFNSIAFQSDIVAERQAIIEQIYSR